MKVLVKEAVKRNPDIQALAARLRAAKGRAVLAGADRFPSVTGVLDARRAERFETREVPPPRMPNAGSQSAGAATTTAAATTEPAAPTTIEIKEFTNQFDLGLNLNWEIDL